MIVASCTLEMLLPMIFSQNVGFQIVYWTDSKFTYPRLRPKLTRKSGTPDSIPVHPCPSFLQVTGLVLQDHKWDKGLLYLPYRS